MTSPPRRDTVDVARLHTMPHEVGTTAGAPVRRPRGRAARWDVLLPALTAVAAGLWGLDRVGPWMDEGYTFGIATRPYPQLWRLLGQVDAVHGTYYVLTHTLLSALSLDRSFEGALVLLRLVSVCGMAAAAAGTAGLGARLAGRRVGLLAGLAFACTPLIGRYSQEARSYAWVTACVVLAAWFLTRALSRARTAGARAGSGGAGRERACCVAFLTFAGLLNLFAVGAALAFTTTVLLAAYRGGAGPRRAPRCWIVPLFVVLVVLVPVGLYALRQSAAVEAPMPSLATVADLGQWFLGHGPAWMLAAPLAALGLIARPRRAGEIPLPMLALPLLVVPPALLVVASQLHPVFRIRYVLYALPGLALLLGAGLDAAGRLAARAVARFRKRRSCARPARWSAGVALFGVVAVVALNVPTQLAIRTPGDRPVDLRAAARVLTQRARPGDAVLFLPHNMRLLTQLYPDTFHALRDVARARSAVASATLTGRDISAARLPAALRGAGRVWLVTRSMGWADRGLRSSGEGRVKLAALRRAHHPTARVRVDGAILTLYQADARQQPAAQAASQHATQAAAPAPGVPGAGRAPRRVAARRSV